MKTIDVDQLKLELDANKGTVLIDIRSAEAWSKGVIEQAMLVAPEACDLQLLDLMEESVIYLICYSGQSSVKLQQKLEKQYPSELPEIISVEGGYRAWHKAGLPLATTFVNQDAVRYSRQLALPGFTREHQEMLSKSRVLVIGAGGLGSPCLMYLAAAGVGQIKVVDDDQVELSNLHRQIVHAESSLGVNKATSAVKRLMGINSTLGFSAVQDRITELNVAEMIDDVDVVIDGSDNLATRYVLNDACYKQSKVLIFSAIYQFEIQTSVFDFKEQNSPCYRCLFPEVKENFSQSCEQAGVLGVTAGLAGTLQATEAIKCLTHIGDPLKGVLLTWNVLNHRHKMIKYKINSQCAHGQ